MNLSRPKSERGEVDRVGAPVFPGLVKVAEGAVPTSQTYDGQMVVRRAQVLCECALNNGSPLDDQR